mgnify:CR=1 FL=1
MDVVTYALAQAYVRKTADAFGTGDGSTTFNVPDLREATPVGVGENDTPTIAEHDVYTLGQFKDDQIQNITGNTKSSTFNGDGATGGVGAIRLTQNTFNRQLSAGSSTGWFDISFDASRVARTGTTTHGKQLGVNYIIKAKQVAVPFDVAEYIRNQNVLSEWEDPIFDGTSFTALYDGVLNMWLSSNVTINAVVSINSTQITRLYPNAGVDSGTQLPIKKGDFLTFSLSSGGIADIYKKVAYYKLRDYTGR